MAGRVELFIIIVSVYLNMLWVTMVTVLKGRVASFVDYIHADDLLSPFLLKACMYRYECIGNKPKCHCEILGKCEGKSSILKICFEKGASIVSMENGRKVMGLEKLFF